MRQHELSQVSEASSEGTKPVQLDQTSVGRLSRMDAMQVQQMAQASARQKSLRLAQVKQALLRVQRDEYGYCLRCEEPIGYARLTAIPETPFCIECQGA